jgi:hypothetical protein
MTQLPAVVTIPDLGLATTLSSSALFEAAQTTNGIGTSIAVPLSQIGATILTTFLSGSAGLPLVGNGSASAPSFQILGVVGGGTGTANITPFGIPYGAGTAALGVTAAGTTGYFLGGNGSALAPSFQLVSLSVVTGVLDVPHGGTGTSLLTANRVLIGAGTSTIASSNLATTGLPLVGNGTASPPGFAVLGVPGGGLGTATTTPYAILVGGTTATAQIQSLATTGASGAILTSQGSAAIPIWSAAGAGTVTSVATDSSLYGGPVTTSGTLGVAVSAAPCGRITLTQGTPVPNSSVSGATTAYYTPFRGRFVPFFNGTNFVQTDIGGELLQLTTDTTHSPAALGTTQVVDYLVWPDSAAITMTIASPAVITYTGHGLAAGSPFRLTTNGALPTGVATSQFYYVLSSGLTTTVFQFAATVGGSAVNSSGSQSGTHTAVLARFTRGVAWSNATTRGTGAGTAELVLMNGLYLNNVAISNGPAAQRGTYVGTVASNTTQTLDMTFGSSASGGGEARLCVWNQDNRRAMRAKVVDSVASWTYTSSTIRSMDNSTTNRISFVQGLSEDTIDCTVMSRAFVSGSNALASIGMALDTTTAQDQKALALTAGSAIATNLSPRNVYSAQIGFHFIQATEASDNTNGAIFGGTGEQALLAVIPM